MPACTKCSLAKKKNMLPGRRSIYRLFSAIIFARSKYETGKENNALDINSHWFAFFSGSALYEAGKVW